MAVLSEKPPRYLWIDVARGIAILAMIVYHLAFDLAFFGWVDWPVDRAIEWRAFAASIASTFLFLAGVSLVCAHGDGIKWRPFWRRIAIIAACAAGVTIATVIAVPAPIYFGILHAIATFSILALLFLRAPVWLTVAAAVVVMIVPQFATSEFFAAPIFYPLGLAPTLPYTFDYEPIFPWLAPTLLGVAVGRLMNNKPANRQPGAFLSSLVFAGRHSLVIYITHQPILFAILIGIGTFVHAG